MKSVIVYPNRLKNFGIMIFGTIFAAALHNFLNSSSVINFWPTDAQVFLYFVMVAFCLVTLFAFFDLILRHGAIVISGEGIKDSSRLAKFGLISWRDIDRIFYKSVSNNEYLCFALKKPEEFLSNQKSLIRAMFLQSIDRCRQAYIKTYLVLSHAPTTPRTF